MRRATALVLVGWALMACGPAPAASAPPPAAASPPQAAAGPAPPVRTALRVTNTGHSGNSMMPWLIWASGAFDKYGLDVGEVADLPSSTTSVQVLISRDADVINVSANPAVEASLKGADLVMIADSPPGTGYWLYAAPDVHSVDDLRGQLIGANQVGSSSYFAVDYALRDRGMLVGRDYDVLTVGSTEAQFAALQQGKVKAVPLSSPATLLARRAGFVELYDLNGVPFNAGGPVVRREMLDDPAGRDALLRYVQAMVETIARFRQDRPFALQLLGRYFETDDMEILDDLYQAYLPKRVPLVVPEGIPPVLESIAPRDPSARDADPRRFYDNSLVEQLQASGFIDALYR
ncbi:MAG TPA: hypothetical protein VK066_17545 [Chloroflexota bacterium]|nr:hypothetical protein [Chloroflexota bacterium]